MINLRFKMPHKVVVGSQQVLFIVGQLPLHLLPIGLPMPVYAARPIGLPRFDVAYWACVKKYRSYLRGFIYRLL